MNLETAVKIINCKQSASKEEELEAYTVFLKKCFKVDVKDENNEYKDLYTIFKEAHEHFKENT